MQHSLPSFRRWASSTQQRTSGRSGLLPATFMQQLNGSWGIPGNEGDFPCLIPFSGQICGGIFHGSITSIHFPIHWKTAVEYLSIPLHTSGWKLRTDIISPCSRFVKLVSIGPSSALDTGPCFCSFPLPSDIYVHTWLFIKNCLPYSNNGSLFGCMLYTFSALC